MKVSREDTPTLDPLVVAELIAKHYSNRTVTKTIPGSPQEETLVVTKRVPYVEIIEVQPKGLRDHMVLNYRKAMIRIRLFMSWVWMLLAACTQETALILKCALICRHRGVCFASPRRPKSVKRSMRQLRCFGRWTWRNACRLMRDRIADLYVREVSRTRIEEGTVTREVEGPPEIVEESIPGKNRILAVGQGRLEFQGHQTQEGVIVTGPPSLMERRSIRYPALSDPALAFQMASEIESALEHVPWVLDGETEHFDVPQEIEPYYARGMVPLRGLEREIVEHCHEMAECFAARSDLLLDVAAVTDSALLGALTPIVNGNTVPLPDALESFEREVASQGGRELEILAERWPVRWQDVTDALREAREFSLREQVAPESLDLGTYISYSAFNFYCPQCNDSKSQRLLARDYSVQGNEDFEPVSFSANSRCLFDPKDEMWRCVTCEYETTHPIPMHRVLDEVLLPAYDYLMNENKVERVRAHQSIRNREIENRNSLETDLERTQIEYLSQIDALGEELERLHVDVSGEMVAIGALEEILRQYEIKQNSVMANIRKSSVQTDREIRERTEAVLTKMDGVKQREMEAMSAELEYLSMAQRKDDERRDAIQRGILSANLEQVTIQRETLAENRIQTGIQRATLAENRIQTGIQRATLAENRIQTGLQSASLSQSRIQTGLQRRSLMENRMQTRIQALSFVENRYQSNLQTISLFGGLVKTRGQRRIARRLRGNAISYL